MDFPYEPNPDDWHEVKLLRELQDLSLVRLTQPRWFKREISEVSSSNRHSRNRRKVEVFSQKRFNVLGDIEGNGDNGKSPELSDVDDINLSDIDESQVEKALGSNDAVEWNQQQIQAKETKTKLMEILNKGKTSKANKLEKQNAQSQEISPLQRTFLTEEERIKEEIRLQKECNEQFFKNVIDKNYEEVQKSIHEGGAEIDYMNEYGLSCLHICCSNGDFKMLEILLKEFKERDLDINFSKKGYRYPVYTHALTATMWGNGCTQQFLDALLAAGAELPAKSRCKALESEMFKQWNQMVEDMEKKKRIEKARGRRGRHKKKKSKSRSKSPKSNKKKKEKRKKGRKKV